MNTAPVPPPAPWRNIATVKKEGTIIYYTNSSPFCGPSTGPLTRKVYKPSHPAIKYIDQPYKDLVGAQILFIANPAAGRGKNPPSRLANSIETVSDILRENGATAVVRKTTHRGHVLEMFEEMGYEGLCQFSAVVSVGGDGTLHEVVNGLVNVCSFAGVDWSAVPPIAIMPHGSGNAIAVSTCIKSPVHAALNIVHGLRTESAKPLALMQYSALSSPTQRLACVAGLQWGLPADVDYGTEHLRWMGDTRYDVGAIKTIMSKRDWSARILVKVHREKNRALWKQLEEQRAKQKKRKAYDITEGLEYLGDDTYAMNGRYVLAVGWNASMVADGFMLTPEAKVSETGVFDFVIFHGGSSRRHMVKILTHTKDGSFTNATDAYHMFKATKVTFEQIEGRFLTIDGELVPLEPLVVEMASEDGKLRILDSFSES